MSCFHLLLKMKPSVVLASGIGCVLFLLLLCFPSEASAESTYVDIILSNKRVCRQCRMETVGEANVRLTNKAGVSAVYPMHELLGIDKHPRWRRFLLKGIYGQGLSGKVITPSAYDERHPGWKDPSF